MAEAQRLGTAPLALTRQYNGLLRGKGAAVVTVKVGAVTVLLISVELKLELVDTWKR